MMTLFLVLVGLANAQPGPFGAGVVLGPTTGASLAWRPSAWNAVQSAIGWDLSASRIDASVDYLRSLTIVEPVASVRMPVYVGIGGGVVTEEPGMFGEGAGVAARVPVGVSVFFEQVPIEVFAQVVPQLRVLPNTGFGVDAGVGGRFYF